MNKKIIIWVFALILLTYLTYSSVTPSLNCNITKVADCSYTKVLYLQNDSGGNENAHAENTSTASYAWTVCCDASIIGDTITADCSDSTFLLLSNGTNAHVQEPSINTYEYDACISATNNDVVCNYRSYNCGANETCLVSYASSDWLNNTDAHVANCSYYSNRVCCGITNNPPTLDNHTLTPEIAYTNSSLELNITCSDLDNTTDTITAFWDVYNATSKISALSSSTTATAGSRTNVQNITQGNLTKHNLWYATVWCNDGSVNSSVQNTTKINISNMVPEAPQLTYPSNNFNTTNRTPTFNWTASLDLDVNDSNDNLTYTIVIDCSTCSQIEETGIITTNYTVPPSKQLDLDKIYNWTVRANDGTDNSSWSETRNITVQSVSIIEVTGTVNFLTLSIGQVEDTTDDSPTPFIVENDGNVDVNVSVYAQSDLWITQKINTSSFQYIVANYTPENGSFNYDESNTSTWVNMPGIDYTAAIEAIKVLNYTDVNDRAELEIRLQVPVIEPPGGVSSVIVFKAEASS